MLPLELPANRPSRFYRGGHLIDLFRRTDAGSNNRPEDWIASTTAIHGEATSGLTRVNGRYLRDEIAASPLAWLGEEHVERLGTDPGLLVKLLAPEQRIPIHVHPGRQFAERNLSSRWGKTEAWIVLEPGPNADVWIGWQQGVLAADLDRMVERQSVDEMLDRMNQVRLEKGDAVLVPAGTAHSISPGMLLLELQEPTDWSILLEWRDLDIADPLEGSLGLGWERASAAVDTSALAPDRLDSLVTRAEQARPDHLLPAAADSFFRAATVTGRGDSQPPRFTVLVIVSGDGTLVCDAGGSLEVTAGTTVVIPAAGGSWRLEGEVTGIACCSGLAS